MRTEFTVFALDLWAHDMMPSVPFSQQSLAVYKQEDILM